MQEMLKSSKVLRMCLGMCIVFTLGCGEKKEEKVAAVRPVKTVVAGAMATKSYSYPGEVMANQQVDLSFRISGPLVSLPVKEGDKVVAGQLLAKIDQRDFKIAFDKAQAELVNAETEYRRMEKLYAGDAVSKAEMENKQARYEVAKAAAMKASVDLSDTSLLAPYDGRVGKLFVENYQDVQAKQPMVSLLDLSAVEIVIDAPENVIATTKKDSIARMYASFPSLPGREFDLEIKEFSTQADDDTQTYRVAFLMERPADATILPGMTAEVNVSFLESDTTGNILLPSQAVATDGKGLPFVWKVENETLTVSKQNVTVGVVTGDGELEILSGVGTGDRIVVAGVNLLSEGMKVKLMDNE